MKVLRPIEITDAMIVESTVFEAAPAAWDAVTTYGLGDIRSVVGLLGEVLIYKSLQASNLNNIPVSSPTWWEYSSSTSVPYNAYDFYAVGDRVFDAGTHKVYQNIVPFNISRSLTNETAWIQVGKNNTALPAKYNPATAYVIGNVIYCENLLVLQFYGGRIFTTVHIAIANSTGVSPTSILQTSWERVVGYPTPFAVAGSYPIGSIVYDASGNSYQSMRDQICGTYLDNPVSWIEVGASNKYAAFDTETSTQTKANKLLTFTVATGRVESVALINAVGDFATVTVREGLGGPVTYTKAVSITSNLARRWWEYFFRSPAIQPKQVLFSGIPLSLNSYITVTVTGGGTVAVGDWIFGRWKNVGLTSFGLQVGIDDFSVITTNDFGNETFVKRGNKKRMDSSNWIPNKEFNDTFLLLRELPATPCLWVAAEVDDFSEALMIKAYYKNFSADIRGPQESYCTLNLIGLI